MQLCESMLLHFTVNCVILKFCSRGIDRFLVHKYFKNICFIRQCFLVAGFEILRFLGHYSTVYSILNLWAVNKIFCVLPIDIIYLLN
jgi:hypothetical protein